MVSSFSGDRCANDCDADEVQDAEDESNEDSEDLDDDKIDDVAAEMMMSARKLMTRKFDDVHLVQGDDYHHLHWHDCNFYRRS